MHTTATDGRDDIAAMAAAAQRLGHSYIAITDHSKALAMANGLDEHRALEHASRVRALNARFEGLTLLAGIECDILAVGGRARPSDRPAAAETRRAASRRRPGHYCGGAARRRARDQLPGRSPGP